MHHSYNATTLHRQARVTSGVPRRLAQHTLLALACFAGTAAGAPGDFDTSFGQRGVVRFTGDGTLPAESVATTLTLDAGGRVLVAGTATQSRTGIVARLLAGGARDNAFGGAGYVLRPLTAGTTTREPLQLFSLAGGNVVLTERIERPCVGSPGLCSINNIFVPRLEATRLRTDGFVDSSYASGGSAALGFTPASVTAGNDGGLSVMGVQPLFPAAALRLARFDSIGLEQTAPDNAALAASISCGSAYTTLPSALVTANHSGGRLLVAQALRNGSTQLNDICITRLNADGSRDSTFGTGGQTVISDAQFSAHFPFRILVRSDNAIQLLLLDAPPKSLHRPALIWLTGSGLPDTTRGVQGIVYPMPAAVASITAATLQADDKLLLAGYPGRIVSGVTTVDESTPRVDRQAASGGVVDFSFGALRGGYADLVTGGERIVPNDIVAAADGSIYVAGGIDVAGGASTTMVVARLLGDTAAPPASNNSGGGGGGGCGITRNGDGRIDPTLPLLLMLAMTFLASARRRPLPRRAGVE